MSKLPSSIFKKLELEVLILKKSTIRNIQEEIGNLTNLKELDLSETSITELPNTIGKLRKLEVLNLSRCYDLKTIPKEIGQLKKLKTLIISYFPGEIPKEITLLQNLEEIYAQGICGTIEPVEFPKWITFLKNIKILDFSNNSIQNLPKELTELCELSSLNLDKSLGYINSIPDLSKLKKLKKLEFSGDGLDEYPSQKILKKLFEVKSLEILKIDNYGMKEKWLSTPEQEKYRILFKDKPNELEFFESNLRINKQNHSYLLKRIKMQPDDLKGISKLINLKELSIQFNDLEELPQEILAMEGLKKLYLYGNHLPKDTVEILKLKKGRLQIITSFSN